MAKSNRSCAAMTNGPSTTKCRRSNSCRFACQAFHGSIPHTAAVQRSKSNWMGDAAHLRDDRAFLRALEIEVDGRCWELDETGEPPAIQFAHMLKREDPDVILSEWGDSTILPLLRQQAERLKCSLPLNRDETAAVQQSRGRSYTSYGRILFKASSITLFGRIHVDKQNSFISEKCDFAGLWELARITKLPIQYAARTTTGTGISYMQMELAHRDGVLIPEQKAEPEDPKSPDELLAADRGGLVFVPKLGFTPNVAELDFVSQFPSIMARFNISPETVNCPCCPDAPRIPQRANRG